MLDIKYALDAKHQYDGGEKTGESWRVNTRDFLVGRMFPIKKLLEWAEQHDGTEVKDEKIEELRPYMDEDPVVISHLLWAFLGINLTGSAKEMYRNAPGSNGLEVWRRLFKHIYMLEMSSGAPSCTGRSTSLGRPPSPRRYMAC